MADYTVDPYRNFRFAIEIDGITDAYFTEIRGIEASYDVIEFRSGDMSPSNAYLKFPGLHRNPTLTLKQGIAESTELYDWFAMDPANTGVFERKDVTIKALDEGGSELATWTFYDAWPCKYVVSDFNAMESGVLIETLELAYRTFERTA